MTAVWLASVSVLDVNAHLGIAEFGVYPWKSPVEPLLLDGEGGALFVVSVDHEGKILL